MAKNIRISDDLYALAQSTAAAQERSIAQQVEYWAKLGLAAQSQSSRFESVMAMLALNHARDRQRLREGKLRDEDLLFIPRATIQASKVEIPDFTP